MQSRCSRQDLLYAVPGMIGNPVSTPLGGSPITLDYGTNSESRTNFPRIQKTLSILPINRLQKEP